jgi:hypothetical protein
MASAACSCSAAASGVGLAALVRSPEPDSVWYAESVRATSSWRSAARPRASVGSGRSVPAERRASGLAAFAWMARRAAAIVGVEEVVCKPTLASTPGTVTAGTTVLTPRPFFSANHAAPAPPAPANDPSCRLLSVACKNSAEGGVRCWRRRRRQTRKTTIKARRSNPTITPPTMAPTGTGLRLLAPVSCVLPEAVPAPGVPEAIAPPGAFVAAPPLVGDSAVGYSSPWLVGGMKSETELNHVEPAVTAFGGGCAAPEVGAPMTVAVLTIVPWEELDVASSEPVVPVPVNEILRVTRVGVGGIEAEELALGSVVDPVATGEDSDVAGGGAASVDEESGEVTGVAGSGSEEAVLGVTEEG